MQTAVISGATSGIGYATTRLLHQHGWHVIATGLPQDDFTVFGDLPHVSPLALDITQDASVNTAMTTIEQQPLHALINCAGINNPAPLELLEIDALKQQFEVNVYGHLRMIQRTLPLLRQTQGRIVNVSSLMGKVAMPVLGAYSMSKHALEALSDTLRIELAPWNIAVCLIEMGAVNTPMTHSMATRLAQVSQQASSSLYQGLITTLQQALGQQAQGAIPAEKVAQAILHAVTARKPKTRYPVDGATQGLFMMRKFAPDSVGDFILARALGIQKRR